MQSKTIVYFISPNFNHTRDDVFRTIQKNCKINDSTSPTASKKVRVCVCVWVLDARRRPHLVPRRVGTMMT